MKKQNSIAFSITSDYDSIKNEEVFSKLLKVLITYAHKLIGNSSLRLSKNKADLAYDISMEAIKRYLENPKKFEPSRNPDLVRFLKYSIIRRLVSNFKGLKGQQNELLFENDDPNGMAVMNAFIKENDIHDKIDLDNTIQLILNDISGNPILIELFELRYINDYTRADIIEKLEITRGEYNNRIRRLDTVRKRVVQRQKIKIRL